MKPIEVIVKENEQEKFEVVEEFTKEEPKKVEVKARQAGKTYDTYKTFIMQNFDGVITATGTFPKEFCETFSLTLSRKKRSLTFERVLEQMEKDGILEKVVQTTGKYKKLQWQFVEKDEEL